MCGLSTRKIRTPCVDPEQADVTQRAPERSPVVAIEVERIDVLILLRRVLGVLDRAVGAVAEPIRMLADPRMIRRTLPGKVQSDFEPEAPGCDLERRGSRQRSPDPDRWPCAPCLGPDGPGAAGIARLGGQPVVASLPEADPDRVNRRQIQHVEPEVGDRAAASSSLRETWRSDWGRGRPIAGTSRTTAPNRARSRSTHT